MRYANASDCDPVDLRVTSCLRKPPCISTRTQRPFEPPFSCFLIFLFSYFLINGPAHTPMSSFARETRGSYARRAGIFVQHASERLRAAVS